MKQEDMHKEFVDPVSHQIMDQPIETYYEPCIRIGQANGYIRVFMHGDGYDTETRINEGALNALGWHKSLPSPILRSGD